MLNSDRHFDQHVMCTIVIVFKNLALEFFSQLKHSGMDTDKLCQGHVQVDLPSN